LWSWKPARRIQCHIIVFPHFGIMSTKLRYHIWLHLISRILQKSNVLLLNTSYPWFDAGVETGDENLSRLLGFAEIVCDLSGFIRSRYWWWWYWGSGWE
jgi:hypothetical protein